MDKETKRLIKQNNEMLYEINEALKGAKSREYTVGGIAGVILILITVFILGFGFNYLI